MIALQVKTKFYGSLAITALLGLAILWFDLRILLPEIVQTSRDIQDIRRQTQIFDTRITHLNLFRQEFNHAKREQESFKALASFSDGLTFLEYIKDLARESGNKASIQTQEDKTTLFRVQLTGTFDSLLDFLILVSATPVQIELNQVTKQESALAQGELRSSLTLIPSFSQPPKK